MTGSALVDQARRLIRCIDPYERQDCYWAMDRETWTAFVRLARPHFQDGFRRNGPEAGDRLFGCPVVVTEDVVGLDLINPAVQGAVAAMPLRHVPAHPRTQAIDAECGWQDAHVLTFDD